MGRRSKNKKASSKIASQALFYIISFYITFLFPSWTRISQMVKGFVEFPVLFLFAVFPHCKDSSMPWYTSDLDFDPTWRQIKTCHYGILLQELELPYQRKKWESMCRRHSRVVELFLSILILPKQRE